MLWEAWLTFEHSHGTVGEIQDALDVIERARVQVETRRAKVMNLSSLFSYALLKVASQEAEQVSYQAMQVAAEQQVAPAPVAEVTEAPREIETPMDIDQEANNAVSGVKRKAEEAPSEESKKARVGACSLASRSRQYLLNSSRTTPNSQAVRSAFPFPRCVTNVCAVL